MFSLIDVTNGGIVIFLINEHFLNGPIYDTEFGINILVSTEQPSKDRVLIGFMKLGIQISTNL